MASILPGFEYDIFISYRHKDNRNGGITEFVEFLKKELEATFKEEVSIYFDSNAQDGLLENHSVDKSLEGKLKCLILIPIISQTYCDTKSFAWRYEFCAFNKMAKEDQFGRDIKLSSGNVASRILPIKVHDLDAEDKAAIESEIGGVLRGIEFIYKEPGVNRPLKVTDKKEENQNHTDYGNQLNKVANAVKEIITALKNSAPSVSRQSVATAPSTTKLSFPKKVTIAVVAFLLIIILGYFAYPKFSNHDQPITESESSTDKSIAVLPFVNMSKDADQEYFSDGLSEELLNLLAKVPELKVIARTSSFSFKGKNEDLRSIGDKLGVAYILEGSVRKSGNILRITAQLIKVEDGSHLWSNTYDRALDDIFKVQDEISAAVVAQLKLKLLKTEIPQVTAQIPEAYNLWLEGRYLGRQYSKEGYEHAVVKFQQALALDSTFAPAWASLAVTYTNQVNSGYIPLKEGLAEAIAATDKALHLNPNLASAYRSRANIYQTYDWDFAKADVASKKALELDSKTSSTLSISGSLAFALGRRKEAISLYKQALAIDPLIGNVYSQLSTVYFYSGQLDEAETADRKLLELVPEYGSAHYSLAMIQLAQGKPEAALETIQKEKDEIWRVAGLPMIYSKMGRKGEADAALKELINKFADGAAYQIAEAYAFRGEKDLAFQWLERAYLQRDGGLSLIKGDPLLENLSDDARMLQFLKKMKLDDESIRKYQE